MARPAGVLCVGGSPASPERVEEATVFQLAPRHSCRPADTPATPITAAQLSSKTRCGGSLVPVSGPKGTTVRTAPPRSSVTHYRCVSAVDGCDLPAHTNKSPGHVRIDSGQRLSRAPNGDPRLILRRIHTGPSAVRHVVGVDVEIVKRADTRPGFVPIRRR